SIKAQSCLCVCQPNRYNSFLHLAVNIDYGYGDDSYGDGDADGDGNRDGDEGGDGGGNDAFHIYSSHIRQRWHSFHFPHKNSIPFRTFSEPRSLDCFISWRLVLPLLAHFHHCSF